MGLQRQCVVMFMVVHIFSSHIFTYPVVLNITTDWSSMTIGLGDESGSSFGTTFQSCVCRNTPKSTCRMPVTEVNTLPDHTSQETLTADSAATYTRDAFFQCKYWYNLNKVYCTQQDESSCPSSDCIINIIIMCTGDKNVVLSWNSIQQPVVLSFTNVAVINCCKSSTTITEVTTISTTLTPTTFTSTQPTTLLTITTSVDSSTITSVGSVQSTSPTPDIITTNSTHMDTAHQQQEAGDASSHTSGQLIGIIVGTAVAAILITILVICIFWKLKTRRESNRRNEQTESIVQVSGNLEEMRGNDLRHTNEGDKKTSKAVAHVSPLIQSLERERHLTQSPGDYTYIDIKSAASSQPSTAITSPSPVVTANHQNSTTAEVVPEMQDSEYSHLGTSKVRLENPYNVLDHQSHSTIIQPVIIPALPIDNRQHKHYLETPYVDIMPANHYISHETEQAIGENENNSLYSHLGESKAQQENTYNSLLCVNDQPIKEPHFTHQNRTTNQNSEIRTEHTPSPNQELDIFPQTSKHKSMEIVDAAPSTYTVITPKTKQETSNDSSQLKNTLNQTASSSGHPMPQEATSLKASTEINMIRGTVQDDKENSTTEDEPGQAYANAVYSMHTCPREDNTAFSLEAPEYANLA